MSDAPRHRASVFLNVVFSLAFCGHMLGLGLTGQYRLVVSTRFMGDRVRIEASRVISPGYVWRSTGLSVD